MFVAYFKLLFVVQLLSDKVMKQQSVLVSVSKIEITQEKGMCADCKSRYIQIYILSDINNFSEITCNSEFKKHICPSPKNKPKLVYYRHLIQFS